jgi:HAE1 family hydrophobic/amphiphilic exporter-1
MTNIGSTQVSSRVSMARANDSWKVSTTGYRRVIHIALQHRPTVIGAAAGLVVLAVILYPRVGTELLPQTDEGQVNVNAQLPIGTRMEVTEAVMLRLEELVKQFVPEATAMVTNGAGGGGGFGGGWQHEPRWYAGQARSA